ncbi:MAG: hypothetical protein U1F40_03630 [Turneriella sp.]
MLSLNTLNENSASLRPQEPKARPRQAEERNQQADFQSYLVSALQQQPRAELPREQVTPRQEQAVAERPPSHAAQTSRAESPADSQVAPPAQKAGHEAPRDGETTANTTDKIQKEQAEPKSRAVTVTRSDRELLEALGLINRKTEIAEKKPAVGTLRAAMDATALRQPQKTEKKPVVFKGESPTHTLTVLEKTPDLVLMSSDGLKKLGEKLGLSLLGKVHEKLSEKNRPNELTQQTVRAEIRSESPQPMVQQKSQKAGAGDHESSADHQQSRGSRQAAVKNVSRETSATEAPVSLRQAQADNIAMVNPSNHDTTVLRTQSNAIPTSEIRLSEAANSARAAENIRTAVENPMVRPDLVRQFNEIISRAQVLVTDTQNAQFSVKLFPREIGRMEIDLKLVDGEIRGKIVVESEDVKNEMQNFLQNREQGGNAEQFDMNKIDIEVRSGNQNAQNPQQAPDTQELLQNLVTQSASAAYSAIESTTGQGNALYA